MFRILHHQFSSNDCVGRLNPASSVFSGVAWRTQHEALEMNLYRSFGNLMEAWVSEGAPDSEWLENNDEDSPLSSSDMETNLRSESVDSGVETPSSDMSFPVTSGLLSAESDTFTAEKEDGLTSASTSQSPVLSSPATLHPSSSSCLSQQQGSTALHLKLEQALQRTESKKENNKTLTVDEVLRRRPRASVLPKRHISDVVRGHRSDSFSLRRTVSPSVLVKQMSETHRRPQSMTFGKLPTQAIAEDFAGEQNTELSPGLMYLEQVCQMLEEIARKQMHNRVLQTEMEALQEHQEMQILSQTVDTCQGDAEAEEETIYCPKLESTEVVQNSSDALQHKEYPNRHMRQRSASDTNLTTLHLRRLKADCRGQHMSTDDLLETAEENQDLQETKKEKRNKTTSTLGRNWRFKIGPLRREDSGKSQQMQPSERNSTRRRLSQLFRRRRKTLLS
ncbi:uncharacterized protein LOC115429587 [Sphaeramia orbicularis]|uniref:uncharacterized protein LOC115429587 n=1 Tax=Sphaeramia orbicularis TaxID=375764 RepID=UPI00117DC6E3|nr:uncharacterized protein LOC115429587 [Sphaeramia orbicularis]